MLNVLRAYALSDPEIGYTQGAARRCRSSQTPRLHATARWVSL